MEFYKREYEEGTKHRIWKGMRGTELSIMPNASMRAAPYCITRRLPTCRTQRAEIGIHLEVIQEHAELLQVPAGKCDQNPDKIYITP